MNISPNGNDFSWLYIQTCQQGGLKWQTEHEQSGYNVCAFSIANVHTMAMEPVLTRKQSLLLNTGHLFSSYATFAEVYTDLASVES